jgi:hypothetical protein
MRLLKTESNDQVAACSPVLVCVQWAVLWLGVAQLKLSELFIVAEDSRLVIMSVAVFKLKFS